MILPDTHQKLFTFSQKGSVFPAKSKVEFRFGCEDLHFRGLKANDWQVRLSPENRVYGYLLLRG